MNPSESQNSHSPFKPMTISTMIGHTLEIYQQAFIPIILIALIASAPNSLVQNLKYFMEKFQSPAAIFIFALIFILSLIMSFWGIGAVMFIASKADQGQETNLKESASWGVQRLMPLVISSFTLMIRLLAPVLIMVSCIAIMGYLSGKSAEFNSKTLLLIALVIVIIVAVAWMVRLMIHYALYYPVVVLENVKGSKSLHRSKVLMQEDPNSKWTETKIWRLSGLLILCMLIVATISIFFKMMSFLVPLGAAPWAGESVIKAMRLGIETIGNALGFPIAPLATSLFFFDTKARNESQKANDHEPSNENSEPLSDIGSPE